jgi:hypothetical protein
MVVSLVDGPQRREAAGNHQAHDEARRIDVNTSQRKLGHEEVTACEPFSRRGPVALAWPKVIPKSL